MLFFFFFFFKQKTAYEMRISDWSSDVCSSDLRITETGAIVNGKEYPLDCLIFATGFEVGTEFTRRAGYDVIGRDGIELKEYWKDGMRTFQGMFTRGFPNCFLVNFGQNAVTASFSYILGEQAKSEEHTSELQSLMRISY